MFGDGAPLIHLSPILPLLPELPAINPTVLILPDCPQTLPQAQPFRVAKCREQALVCSPPRPGAASALGLWAHNLKSSRKPLRHAVMSSPE